MSYSKKVAAVELAQVVVQDADNQPVEVPAVVSPTQVRYPNKSAIRTVFQALVGLAVMWPIIVAALALPDWAWIGTSLVIAAGVTKIMAIPGVETWLRTYFPFLSAAPQIKQGEVDQLANPLTPPAPVAPPAPQAALGGFEQPVADENA